MHAHSHLTTCLPVNSWASECILVHTMSANTVAALAKRVCTMRARRTAPRRRVFCQQQGPASARARAQEAEMYARSLGTVNELEAAFGALWTQCQRCQGSLHQARPLARLHCSASVQ